MVLPNNIKRYGDMGISMIGPQDHIFLTLLTHRPPLLGTPLTVFKPLQQNSQWDPNKMEKIYNMNLYTKGHSSLHITIHMHSPKDRPSTKTQRRKQRDTTRQIPFMNRFINQDRVHIISATKKKCIDQK